MPRANRCFEANASYHVTMRCNNQAFDLRRPLARKVLLFGYANDGDRWQADLFGSSLRHGGPRCQVRRGVTLRAGLLTEVTEFCRVNG